METNRPSRLTFTSGIMLGLMVGVPLGIVAIKAVGLPKPPLAQFFNEGFTFERLRDERLVEAGMGNGARIDLTMLRTPDGRTLKEAVGGGARLAMLLVFDPQCGVCKNASDQIRSVHDRVESADIPYYVVSFAPTGSAPEFHRASEALGIGAQSFRWVIDEPFKMPLQAGTPVPSHILIDQDGTVLRVWPGAGDDKATRERMANQIVTDTNVVIETLDSLKRKGDSGETPRAQ